MMTWTHNPPQHSFIVGDLVALPKGSPMSVMQVRNDGVLVCRWNMGFDVAAFDAATLRKVKSSPWIEGEYATKHTNR